MKILLFTISIMLLPISISHAKISQAALPPALNELRNWGNTEIINTGGEGVAVFNFQWFERITPTINIFSNIR